MKKTSRKKTFLLIAAGVLVLYFAAMCSITSAVMHDQFGRFDYDEFTLYKQYDPDYIDSYPRENVQFTSGENTLQGFIYGLDNEEPRALLVFAHGITVGHEDYINQLIWFVDHNYLVFAYDATGSGYSEGKNTVGLVQSALDLNQALYYVESEPRFDGLPVCLLGHSWGGFAAAGVQNFDHDLTAVCSMSGYAYPLEMLELGAEQVMGTLPGKLFYPFVWGYNRMVFGEYAGLNAIDGINRTDTPNLIIHGEMDDFVDYSRVSILSKQQEITNPNAEFLTLKGEYAKHNSFFDSDTSNDYKKAWNEAHEKELKELGKKYGKIDDLPADVRRELYADVDRSIINLYNTDLLETIDAFYTRALEAE